MIRYNKPATGIIQTPNIMKLIFKFSELDNTRVKEVGGKNASLGEMFKKLDPKGIKIPDGFAKRSGTDRK